MTSIMKPKITIDSYYCPIFLMMQQESTNQINQINITNNDENSVAFDVILT